MDVLEIGKVSNMQTYNNETVNFAQLFPFWNSLHQINLYIMQKIHNLMFDVFVIVIEWRIDIDNLLFFYVFLLTDICSKCF